MTAESDETLPTPLAAALDELFAWMQKQLLADEARSTPCSPLYHYTSEAALRGILEHQKLWCFRHSQQSDDKEVTYSLEIARRVIREEAARGNPAVESLPLGLDDLLSNNPMGEMFDFYFFSLSSHRDDARQWTDYGDKGKGFAIGFSPALFQPDRTELASRPNENVFVGEVIYGRDATRTRHRCGVRKLAEITGRVTQANSSIMQGTNPQVWFDEMNKSFIAMLLIWNCLTAKADQFRGEQETRYIIIGVREAFDSCRRLHNGRDYVETPLPLSEAGNITEMIVGPDAPDGAEAMVQDLLRSHGYPHGIRVTRSAVRTDRPRA
jgi:hypothetical protein